MLRGRHYYSHAIIVLVRAVKLASIDILPQVRRRLLSFLGGRAVLCFLSLLSHLSRSEVLVFQPRLFVHADHLHRMHCTKCQGLQNAEMSTLMKFFFIIINNLYHSRINALNCSGVFRICITGGGQDLGTDVLNSDRGVWELKDFFCKLIHKL